MSGAARIDAFADRLQAPDLATRAYSRFASIVGAYHLPVSPDAPLSQGEFQAFQIRLFDHLERNFLRIDHRFDVVDRRFAEMDGRFDEICGLRARVDVLQLQVRNLEKRVDREPEP